MIAVLVCHSQQAVADALATRLSTEPDIRALAGQIAGPRRFRNAPNFAPDVLLLDLPLGRGQVAQVVESFAGHEGSLALLLLTPATRLPDVVEAIAAGVDGWVAEEAPIDSLLEAIRGVAAGYLWLPHEHLRDFFHLMPQNGSARRERERLERLTGREALTLRHLLRGDDAATIARRLGISTSTARVHIRHLLAKLEVHTTLEAVALARRARFPTEEGSPPLRGGPASSAG